MSIKTLDLPEKPQESDYVIAYVDLLGTKKMLQEQDNADVFDGIYTSFLTATKLLPSCLEEYFLNELEVKVFSDNILVAYKVSDCTDKKCVYNAYDKITLFLRFFLAMLTNDGHLFRGAITLGKLLINDVMVWGKGLSEVVELEENVAIYPRVILSENILKVFDEFGLDGVKYEEKFRCLKDFDECVFYDFFEYNDWGSMDSLLYNANYHLGEKFKNEKEPKTLQKLYWYRNYINRVTEIYEEVKSMYYE